MFFLPRKFSEHFAERKVVSAPQHLHDVLDDVMGSLVRGPLDMRDEIDFVEQVLRRGLEGLERVRALESYQPLVTAVRTAIDHRNLDELRQALEAAKAIPEEARSAFVPKLWRDAFELERAEVRALLQESGFGIPADRERARRLMEDVLDGWRGNWDHVALAQRVKTLLGGDTWGSRFLDTMVAQRRWEALGVFDGSDYAKRVTGDSLLRYGKLSDLREVVRNGTFVRDLGPVCRQFLVEAAHNESISKRQGHALGVDHLHELLDLLSSLCTPDGETGEQTVKRVLPDCWRRMDWAVCSDDDLRSLQRVGMFDGAPAEPIGHALAQKNDFETLDRLLRLRIIDVNTVDNRARTAAHVVASAPNAGKDPSGLPTSIRTMGVLIEHGIDFTAKDETGKTALDGVHRSRKVMLEMVRSAVARQAVKTSRKPARKARKATMA